MSTYYRWVYLRKPASEGPFELHSDFDSLIGHHKKILTLQSAVLLTQIGPLVNGIAHGFEGGFGSGLSYMVPIFVITSSLLISLIAKGLITLKRLKKRTTNKRVMTYN